MGLKLLALCNDQYPRSSSHFSKRLVTSVGYEWVITSDARAHPINEERPRWRRQYGNEPFKGRFLLILSACGSIRFKASFFFLPWWWSFFFGGVRGEKRRFSGWTFWLSLPPSSELSLLPGDMLKTTTERVGKTPRTSQGQGCADFFCFVLVWCYSSCCYLSFPNIGIIHSKRKKQQQR